MTSHDNKVGENHYHSVFTDIITYLETKYPAVSDKWRNKEKNLHILPFALIQKGSYVLRDLLEAILKDEGHCQPTPVFMNDLDYLNFLVGKIRNRKDDGDSTEYIKVDCLAKTPNDPVYFLSFVHNAIATITVQLPTLRSIKRFVKGVKSIFGPSFWKEIDQTMILGEDGKTTITLQTHNRCRFHDEDPKNKHEIRTKDPDTPIRRGCL